MSAADQPYLGESDEVKLNWKKRRESSAGKEVDRGSFYSTLPKRFVDELGWKKGIDLEVRRTEHGFFLRPRSVPNRAVPRRPLKLDRVIRGDVLECLRELPDSSVHLAMTSPPYNVGVDYAGYADDREYAAFRGWLQGVWRELYRVLVKGGRFVLQTAPTSISAFRPIHTDLTNDARDVGFKFRAEIIWYKQNMTARRTAWGSWKSPAHPHVIPSWEFVNVLQKDGWKLTPEPGMSVDITGDEFVQWSDALWRIPPDTERPGNHPATFPRELVERVLRFFSFRGQTILDPFGGSGTVAVVAKETGRHFLSIDQSEEYSLLASARVAKTRFGADGRGRTSTGDSKPQA